MNREFLDEAYAAMFSNPKYADYLFYAHILGQCSTKIVEDFPAPAAVTFVQDHVELIINPKMMAEFPVNERIGVLKHEALHIINGHLSKRFSEYKGLNHRILNIAMDCANNQSIKREDLPEGVIYPDTLSSELSKIAGKNVEVPKNQSSEFYYNLIMEHKPEENPEDKNGDKAEGSGDSDENSQGQGSFLENAFNQIDSHDGFGEGEQAPEEFIKNRVKDMLEKAKDATLSSNGSLPSDFNELLKINSPKKSEIPWQKLFQNVSSNTKKDTRSTYMRKSRRFGNRPDVKGKLSNRTFEWLTIVDVSGSMPTESVQKCLGEVINLCKKMDTSSRMIQVDVEAKKSEELNANIKTFSRLAAGGTFMYGGIEQAKSEKLQYDAVLVLTDGGLCQSDIDSFDNLKMPVIWIVTDDYNEDLNRFKSKTMKAARLKTR